MASATTSSTKRESEEEKKKKPTTSEFEERCSGRTGFSHQYLTFPHNDARTHRFTFIMTFITQVKYADRWGREEKEGKLRQNLDAQVDITYRKICQDSDLSSSLKV
jgi:hypothetical protein